MDTSVFGYNTSILSSTKFCPFELNQMFARRPNLPIDLEDAAATYAVLDERDILKQAEVMKEGNGRGKEQHFGCTGKAEAAIR